MLVACGQNINVPKIILKGANLLLPTNLEIVIASDHHAKTSTLRDVRSSC